MEYQAINAPRLPRTKVIQWNSGHKLEIQAATADQAVDRNILAELFDFREVFIDHLGDCLETLRRRLVTLVFATPFTTDSVEGHGAVCEGDIGQ